MKKQHPLDLFNDFLNYQAPHPRCPFNPQCPPEIIKVFLSRLSPKMQVAVNYLRINHQDPAFRINHLALEFNISLRQVERLFLIELGCTPKTCLEQIQIYHYQKQRIENDSLVVKKALSTVGFSSRGGFEYARRKYLG